MLKVLIIFHSDSEEGDDTLSPFLTLPCQRIRNLMKYHNGFRILRNRISSRFIHKDQGHGGEGDQGHGGEGDQGHGGEGDQGHGGEGDQGHGGEGTKGTEARGTSLNKC